VRVRSFDVAYEGTPTWDLDRPQPAVVRLAEAGAFRDPILDAGCGTGEHALYLAARGHEVVGIDTAAAAIERATAKATRRGLDVTFLRHDALEAPALGRTFATVLDVGLFHVLTDEQRPAYASALHRAMSVGGTLLLLCWSERNPWGFGPRRVTRDELRASFANGWSVDAIDAEVLESRLEVGPIHAWLARLGRR
jgi:SAM-dependent methyltransferase